MPGGGWLSLRGVEIGDVEIEDVEISVRDTGPGILPDDLPRIFDAGFSTRPGSSGLGLAVCRRILEQHAGSIAAESRPGYGATFRLRLPRNAAAGAGQLSADLPGPPCESSSPENAPVAEPGAASGAAR
jgi:signal transduction histidine kinase